MSKNIKIKATTNPSDKYIKVKLEQDFDTLEILSLNLTQSEIYSSFNADYGVLVGKVQANNNIGIPNAKISVFIPITDDDKLNPDILSIYPYESTRDKDNDGKKYNLLPRVSQGNEFLTQGAIAPPVPVGSFPTKEEILTNPTFLEVYEKYYKYTTVSNEIGDYMIFGAPIGVQDVHMSVDITDIGRFSMTPGTMISQLGYSANLFDGNKIKKTTDLDILPNVELQTISVDVKPFWGDDNNFEIGITRQDFKLRATLVSSITVFGAGFTDNFDAIIGYDSYFGNRDNSATAMSRNRGLEEDGKTLNEGVKYNCGMASRRNGDFSIEVYTIPNTVSSSDIASGNWNPSTDAVLLDKTQYNEILDDGMFILTLPCNRTKKIFDQTTGELVLTSDDDPNGVFTEFVGAFIIDYAPELSIRNEPANKSRNDRNRSDRGRIKIPQTASFENTFTSERPGIIVGKTVAQRQELNEQWRKQVFTFTGGKTYSIAKFNGLTIETDQAYYNGPSDNIFRNAGILAEISTEDASQEIPTNSIATYWKIGGGGDEKIENVPVFGGEWLNFAFYFPQIYNYTSGGYDVTRFLTTDYGSSSDMTIQNNYQVLGFRRDTSYFLRSDLHQTQFVEVPTSDLVNILNNTTRKGFSSADPEFTPSNQLSGGYPSNSGIRYFYKGFGNADIIRFLVSNGIISV